MRNVRDVRRTTDVPVVGTVKADKATSRGLPLADTVPSPLFHEEVGQLRLRAQALAAGAERPVYVLTSAGESEGKTTVATALAIALAESGQQVTCSMPTCARRAWRRSSACRRRAGWRTC